MPPRATSSTISYWPTRRRAGGVLGSMVSSLRDAGCGVLEKGLQHGEGRPEPPLASLLPHGQPAREVAPVSGEPVTLHLHDARRAEHAAVLLLVVDGQAVHLHHDVAELEATAVCGRARIDADHEQPAPVVDVLRQGA